MKVIIAFALRQTRKQWNYVFCAVLYYALLIFSSRLMSWMDYASFLIALLLPYETYPKKGFIYVS